MRKSILSNSANGGHAMRENWTTETETIRNELNLLRTSRTQLAFLQEAAPPQLAIIKATQQVKDLEVLIVQQAKEVENLSDECLFFYRPQGAALRGFRCQPLRKINKLLGLKFPTEIFLVERRQHPRLTTPESALAVFSIANRQRPLKTTVRNLSQQGARLLGQGGPHPRVGTTITPLTLSLYSGKNNQSEFRIQMAEALVVWCKKVEEEGQEFGITFKLSGDERYHLENYLATQTMEKECSKEKSPLAPTAVPPSPPSNPCK